MKKLISFILLAVCSVSLLAGCSGATFSSIPDENKIMSDLNATDFISAKGLYGKDETRTIPISEVTIIDTLEEENYCLINCNVIQQNENYMKKSQVAISYDKFDEWFMGTYNATNVSVAPLSGVPDDIIKNAYEIKTLEGYSEDSKCTVECSSIKHNFNYDAHTDDVKAECIVTSNTCKKVVEVSLNYNFTDKWEAEDNSTAVVSREWLADKLKGTEWEAQLGFGGVRNLKINNIDTANKTISIDYGAGSLNNSEVCKYEVRDYERFGEKAQALVVSLTHDSYDVEILEDGIHYGAKMTKITK